MSLPPPLPQSLPPALPVLAPVTPKVDHSSVWQLVLGIIGSLLSLLSLLGLLIIYLVSQNQQFQSVFNQTSIPSYVWICLLLLGLSVFSIFYAARRLRGHEAPVFRVTTSTLLWMGGGLILWGALLYTGYEADSWHLPSVLSALVSLLAILLPIVILFSLGAYRLQFGSKQRAWGLMTFSAFVSTQLAIFVEMFIFLIAGVLGYFWLSHQSQFAQALSLLSHPESLTESNLSTIVMRLTPLLSQPEFYLFVGLLFCLLIPLTEELFKPLGVWFLAGKKLTPAQGFTAGLVCGAVFGAFESSTIVGAATGDMWLPTVVARVGTGLLHMLTTAISGWALAQTWQDNKFGRLSLIYLAMVALHGVWNFFALAMALQSLVLPINSTFLSAASSISVWVLLGLAGFMLAMLIVLNFSLRKRTTPPAMPQLSDTLNQSI
jgi:hypothetical protein